MRKSAEALKSLANTVIDTNLRRATLIAKSISRQQTLPAWLGMAPVQRAAIAHGIAGAISPQRDRR